ncbi:MAG TPA: RNA polymerase sigma-70 factor [Bacteroidales bacterium]|nr:RNA polymerase sigma-70 factor [Bacteroidales bacterium]HBQ84125.1 RNA polymerase sigma-70 factor [Bacteroidales bacterium]HCU17689.1 RNA polymerase sigma-70 factor [Bacteroidales bacterium]
MGTKYNAIENESMLVRHLARGNLLAFNTLFKEYGNRLYRFALGYLKSESEAEDVVQEVFTIIWEKRASLKEDLSFRSYLFTIAFNIIRKHFRTKAYLAEYFKARNVIEQDLQTLNEITYRSLNQYIAKLIDQLPERRREIFIKSRFEGKSIKEIAEELKISHKTVENHITDVLRFIRKNIVFELYLLSFCISFLFSQI